MSSQPQIVASWPVLAVHDLATSADWLVRVLGCTVTEPDPGNWAFCRTGEITFMVGRCPDALPATEIGDHSYVAYLTVVDLEGFHRRAVAEGAEIVKGPVDEPWGMREMALRSPDGHRFMLGEQLS